MYMYLLLSKMFYTVFLIMLNMLKFLLIFPQNEFGIWLIGSKLWQVFFCALIFNFLYVRHFTCTCSSVLCQPKLSHKATDMYM